MRRDRGERGKEKKKNSRSGSPTHCRSVLNQLRGSHSRCHAVLDILWWTARRSASWWTAMAPPVWGQPAASPPFPTPPQTWRTAAGSGLLANGADSSAPSSMTATPPRPRSTAASLPPHLLFHCSSTTASGSDWRSLLLPAARRPQHSDPPQQRGLSDLTACPFFLPGFGTNVTQFVEREGGGGNRRTFKRL